MGGGAGGGGCPNDLDSRLELQFMNNLRTMVLQQLTTRKEINFFFKVTNGPRALDLATSVTYRFGRYLVKNVGL